MTKMKIISGKNTFLTRIGKQDISVSGSGTMGNEVKFRGDGSISVPYKVEVRGEKGIVAFKAIVNPRIKPAKFDTILLDGKYTIECVEIKLNDITSI